MVRRGPRPPLSPAAPCRAAIYPGARARPGSCRSVGQLVPVRARPREPPPSAPAEPRGGGGGGHLEGGSRPPPLSSTFSFSSFSPGTYSLRFPPLSLFFAGHPGQSEPVVTARLAGGRRRRRWRRKSGR